MAEKAVAPHAGSVDRNVMCCLLYCDEVPSLPTRGAWIEILNGHTSQNCASVAPHAGSVDRNFICNFKPLFARMSLPTRGAWIEIKYQNCSPVSATSLPTRGAWIEIPVCKGDYEEVHRRSPRGERG